MRTLRFRFAGNLPVFLALLLVVGAHTFGQSTRGRVRLSDKTIVTDWGTPLRGCYWALDVNGGKPPDRAQLRAIKGLGLNALHLWAECYWQKQAGVNAPAADSCVKWCREESLYVVICYGGCDANNHFFIDQLKAFWNFYAPRYKDETHVVYEIQNEPAESTQIFHDTVINMNRECYQIIRSHAPETHVLFFSLCCMWGGSAPIVRDVERLGPDIDWTNASIAFHGYFVHADSQAVFLEQAFEQGVRMTCTEFPGGCNSQYNWFNEILPKTYEKEGISYLYFCPLNQAPAEVHSVANSGVTWQPDFGNWPQPHVDQTVAARNHHTRRLHADGAGALPVLTVGALPHGDFRSWMLYDLRGRVVPLEMNGNPRGRLPASPARFGSGLLIAGPRSRD